MPFVIHRGTELVTTFDVVDDDGNIIGQEPVRFKSTTLLEADFQEMLKGIHEVRQALQKKHGIEELNLQKISKKLDELQAKFDEKPEEVIVEVVQAQQPAIAGPVAKTKKKK